MGILNVTPDSFSDGGRFFSDGDEDVAAAVAAGEELWAAGADIVDVGGESTRPGAMPVALEVELRRTIPVVDALARRGMVVSIDTSKPAVAAAALDAGASIVNDVSGLRHPDMAGLCRDSGSGVVMMHMQGDPATMQDNPRYTDVVAEVKQALIVGLERSGLDPATVCIDPGIGFGKTADHNLELLGRLDEIVALGQPVLVGASRKGTLVRILESGGRENPSLEQRDRATGASTALAIAAGAAVVRVHNVAHTVDVARTADAIVRSHISRGDR
jgi:dihydropteroate synthase